MHKMTQKNKVYCCSNQLRTEALIIGVIELIFSSFSMLMTGLIAYSAYSNEREWLNNPADEDDIGDLGTFLKLPSETQQIMILITFLAETASVLTSLILLLGVQHKKALVLKLCLILGCLKLFYTIFKALACVFTTQHKIFYAGVSIMWVIYSLYYLNIVRLFIKELSHPPSSDSSAQLHPQMYFDDQSMEEDGRGSMSTATTDIDARFGSMNRVTECQWCQYDGIDYYNVKGEF